MMSKILKILAGVAAIAAGWPLSVLLVQLACTTPVFGYCGGHEHAGAVYLSFWAVTAFLLWLVLRTLVKRWASSKLPVFHLD
jgi:hypothetical protein